MATPSSEPDDRDVVQPGAVPAGGVVAERDADADGEDHRRDGKLDRGRERPGHLLDDRPMGTGAIAEVERHGARRGTSQYWTYHGWSSPYCLSMRGDLIGGCALSQEGLGRPSRESA